MRYWRSRARANGALLVATALVVLCTGPAAAGAATGDRVAGVESSAARLDPSQTRAYWTPERMRQARPLATLLAGSRGRAAERQPRLHAPVQRHQVLDTGTYPNSAQGKVFGTIPELGDFECSATAVHSTAGNLVLSAGHCVYDHDFCGGCWATNWQFVPGYHDGATPFGTWPATQLQATQGWTADADPSFDVGVAVLAPRDGQNMEQVSGALGVEFDSPREQTYVAYGYPGAAPFDGGDLWACTSAYGGSDAGTPPEPMRISCDMTSGSSGGGWVVSGRYVASVTSYGYLLVGINDLYGPYFGSEIQALYHSAGGSADPGAVEIIRAPRARTLDRTPTFRFRSDVLGGLGIFRCRIDRRPWNPCESPRTFGRLGTGKHTFKVEAGDWEGGWSGVPTVRSFTIAARR